MSFGVYFGTQNCYILLPDSWGNMQEIPWVNTNKIAFLRIGMFLAKIGAIHKEEEYRGF
jgi:hypothetical protein